MNKKFDKLFLTFFGVGLLKPAPGTWGSFFGSIVAILIVMIDSKTLFLLSILIFLLSIPIIDRYEKHTLSHDSNEIVIDEVAGVWFAISFVGNSYLLIFLAFVFFRIFDITKPSIIGRIDRRVKGGLGVMLDDMIAGGCAGIATLIVATIIHKLELTYILSYGVKSFFN